MSTNPLVSETEQDLRVLSTALTEARADECLLCYVYRMLAFGCTGHRWTRHYRDLRAPRATALERRLREKGGFCDCEIFVNGYEPVPEHWVTDRTNEDWAGDEDEDTDSEDPTYPDPMPSCRGVRAGSTQGCSLWRRLSRW